MVVGSNTSSFGKRGANEKKVRPPELSDAELTALEQRARDWNPVNAWVYSDDRLSAKTIDDEIEITIVDPEVSLPVEKAAEEPDMRNPFRWLDTMTMRFRSRLFSADIPVQRYHYYTDTRDRGPHGRLTRYLYWRVSYEDFDIAIDSLCDVAPCQSLRSVWLAFDRMFFSAFTNWESLNCEQGVRGSRSCRSVWGGHLLNGWANNMIRNRVRFAVEMRMYPSESSGYSSVFSRLKTDWIGFSEDGHYGVRHRLTGDYLIFRRKAGLSAGVKSIRAAKSFDIFELGVAGQKLEIPVFEEDGGGGSCIEFRWVIEEMAVIALANGYSLDDAAQASWNDQTNEAPSAAAILVGPPTDPVFRWDWQQTIVEAAQAWRFAQSNQSQQVLQTINIVPVQNEHPDFKRADYDATLLPGNFWEFKPFLIGSMGA